MTKESVRKILSEVVNANRESDGWTNLVKVGNPLKNKGVDFRALGYDKLFELIKDHRDTFNWNIDKETNPGFFIVFVREKTETEKKKYETLLRAKNNPNPSLVNDPKNALIQWASLGDFLTSIESLKEIALPERWYYSNQNPKNPYPILTNYIKYTYYRLSREKGKILIKDNVAAFNTGLVDKRYEPIYAMFTKTPNALRNWRLESFCIAGEDEGKELAKRFSPLPPRAHYFDKVSDMLYDTLAPKPILDWNHIIIENIDRLPYYFLEENQPKGFELKKVDSMTFQDREQYYIDLAAAIQADNKVYRSMTNRFKDALELSLKRVEWNFKTAIPTYFPTHNKMSLLLPLSLVDDEKVDIALVVEKTESGNYLGHTILPLEWAYSNSRLVCRPDSDWLVADAIQQEIDESLLDDEE
jgi:hypothetical protein